MLRLHQLGAPQTQRYSSPRGHGEWLMRFTTNV